MGADALVTLMKAVKRYGSRIILEDISLCIGQGESIIVRGRNGSGKSTLLRIVAGLVPLTSGERTLRHAGVRIGYTPDRLSKLRMSSTEYLSYMGRISGVPGRELQHRIQELHRFFQLDQNRDLKLTNFSKGMLQKVNLMQAAINTPDLLILDEPFSGLDKESTGHLLNALKTMKAKGTTILAAVHDPLLASALDSRIYQIREGKLYEEAVEIKQDACITAFEIECRVSEATFYHIRNLFPDCISNREDTGFTQFTILQKDYHDFMLESVHQEIELLSLLRKERTG